ncbi:hypothetical protein ACWCQV_39775, partial [Streptomyces eurythermus]
MRTVLWRASLASAVVCGIGLLPWLSRTDPALTVLKARAQDRDPDPAVLAAIRDQLGLDAGPSVLLGRWLGGLPRGDAGRSWISGAEAGPVVVQALGASLLLFQRDGQGGLQVCPGKEAEAQEWTPVEPAD